jgi:hypothetical protein
MSAGCCIHWFNAKDEDEGWGRGMTRGGKKINV